MNVPPPPDPGHAFPPPEQVEEMQAFAFIAGYEFKAEGRGWTDGTGRIRGCSWQLSKLSIPGRQPAYVIAEWSEYCPTMADMKACIRDNLDRIERQRKRGK